jgi:Na+-transporting methylmalonyl-CoA/oxaloacetate decarboxylase gamma subunit
MDIMTKIGPAIEMMVQGMLGIFVVLGIIALMVAFLKKLDNRK